MKNRLCKLAQTLLRKGDESYFYNYYVTAGLYFVLGGFFLTVYEVLDEKL